MLPDNKRIMEPLLERNDTNG